MEPDFWQERWQRNEIGFHQEQINPYLQQFWDELNISSDQRVFVPLCGKSRDLLWLAGQGYKVLGVELSTIAVEAFFDENDLDVAVTDRGKFTLWKHESLEILCGNFFDLRSDDVADVSAVYDRASLIALPPAMRQKYAQHLAAIMPEQAKILLVTLCYPDNQMSGPPFPVLPKEVERLYGERYQVKNIASFDVLEKNPRFREKGITELRENIYILKNHYAH